MSVERASYRRYAGEARVLRLRFLAIARSGIRSAFKGKLALLLLLVIPGGWAAVFSFNVHLKFAASQGIPGDSMGLPFTAPSLMAAMIQVNDMVYRFFWLSRLFGLLVIAWYGAGLLAEDRRHGAHLLYFSRPLSRVDYLLGKFLVVFAFGCLVTLVPGLFICGTAAFSSPDWVWLREESNVLFGTIGFSLLATTYYALVVLAASSLVRRRAYALVGAFAFVLITEASGNVLWRLSGNRHFMIMGPLTSLRRVAKWCLDRPDGWTTWPVGESLAVLGATALVCLALVIWRVRKLEEIG